MKYNEIVEVLAPCGLNCTKCLAFTHGEIKNTASELQQLLGSFDNYAKRFSDFNSVFENYPSFKALLEYFTQATCKGCRNGDCIHPNCGVISCYKEKGIDFCFQCNEYPCEKTNFDPNLRERWIKMNDRMKQIGVEEYFKESQDLPRYV